MPRSTTKTVAVTQFVLVTVDADAFTPEFMEDFPRHFYPFDTLDEHIEHIAQLAARGLIDGTNPFIEGYGRAEEMGIRVDTESLDGRVTAKVEAPTDAR